MDEPAPAADAWREMTGGLRGPDQVPFDEQWRLWQEHARRWDPRQGPPPAWWPDDDVVARANLSRLAETLGVTTMTGLHEWSVQNRAELWRRVVEGLAVVFADPPARILDDSAGALDARWLPGARLNIVESCFGAPSERVAVIVGDEEGGEPTRITYGELEELVDRCARGLTRRGLGPGSRVALYLPMNLEAVVAYLGVVRAGCVVVSIADSFPAGELIRRLRLAEADLVVTASGVVRGGRPLDPHARVREVEGPPAVVVRGPGEVGALRPGDQPWEELLAAGVGCSAVVGEPSDLTNILFSSGTTGEPKLIPWTQLTPLKCAMDGHFHQDIRAGDVVAWPTNIGWMMGPWLIYAGLVNGATVALYDGHPGGRGFARFVEDAGVTVLGVVPSLVRRWLGSGALEGADWSGVRVLSSTGEPSSRRDYLWLMSRTLYRAPVIEYCGGTEIGGGYLTGSVIQPASPATFSTPALGLDLVVLDEGGRPVEVGGTGEVFLVPPSIGLSDRLLNRDHDEVYHRGVPPGPGGLSLRRHGDQVERLPGGYFRAQGRVDDTMNLGGIKVSSAELERAVETHEAVRECGAVGVREGGEGAERLVLFVVPAGDLDPATLRRELERLVAGRVNPLFKVHRVELVDELPRTASNKVMRRRLREAAAD